MSTRITMIVDLDDTQDVSVARDIVDACRARLESIHLDHATITVRSMELGLRADKREGDLHQEYPT